MPLTVTFNNRYGQRLVGSLYEPANATGLVIIQHGAAGSRVQPYITAIAERLYKNGLAVLTFDAANAFGESEGDLSKACLTRHHHDLIDVVSWAKAQPWYQEPFSLIGHSLGGASVILYATSWPDQVAHLVPLSPVMGYQDWSYAYQTYRLDAWEIWQREGYLEKIDATTGRSGRFGKVFLDDLRQYELGQNLRKLRVPILVISGDRDMTTPVECVKSFWQHLPAELQPQSKLIIRPNAPHTFVTDADIACLGEEIGSWIRN